MTTVRRITVYQELSELASAWNELARGVPFRQWEWLHSWWEEFGETSELYTLTVRDDHDKLLGVAPWYIENSSTRGRVIRFLGSGSVCTDYQSLLCRREDSQTVAGAIANWLKQAGSSTVIANGNDGWDLIDLEGIDAEDATITALTESLKQTGVNVWETPGLNCWRLPLPRTIPDFVSLFGKSSKSQVKRMINRLAKSDDLQVGLVSTREELDSIWGKFVELHQRRWRSLG
ncbi:MAG: hypothetical protein KDA99_26025, partial [Planctomycetales bacterium]|nr:hypothetical protein [Planctomycetales bacterium]